MTQEKAETTKVNRIFDRYTFTELFAVQHLASLYEEMYKTEEFDTDTVTKFYDYLTQTLASEPLLDNLMIQDASDLQEIMVTVDNFTFGSKA